MAIYYVIANYLISVMIDTDNDLLVTVLKLL